jgi:hypothetical protein
MASPAVTLHQYQYPQAMNWGDASKVLLAVLPVIGAVAKLLSGATLGRRGRLTANADLLAKLPKGSQAYEAVLAQLGNDAALLVQEERRPRRNVVGIVLSVGFVVIAAGVALAAAATGSPMSWFLWAAAVLVAFFGVVGLMQDAVRRERDDKGRPIRAHTTPRRE